MHGADPSQLLANEMTEKIALSSAAKSSSSDEPPVDIGDQGKKD